VLLKPNKITFPLVMVAYQKVANQLYELGYMTGAGKPYQQDFIYRMLK
jgi:hypothetical protein